MRSSKAASGLFCLALAYGTAALADAETSPSSPVVQKRYALDADGKTALPSLAIDHVCAWPLLLTLPDKTILAFLFNQPSHGRMVGDVDCWASSDEGHTWNKRGVVSPHDAGTETNRMNHAAGLAPNGDLLALVGGWTLKSEPNDLGPDQVVEQLPTRVSFSKDGGANWTCSEGSFPPQSPLGFTFVPHGSILQGKDGSWRAAAYSFSPAKTTKAYVLRSDDQGKTWKDPLPIDPQANLGETFLWTNHQGRWLAAARGASVEVYASLDDAKTWSHLSTATGRNAVPGQIISLSDGRLLLSNGNRTKGDEHVEASISDDGGKTWCAPVRIVDFQTFDGGYPSSVQLSDGRIVTAYYARKTTYHQGYHMGTVLWDPNKTFPKSP